MLGVGVCFLECRGYRLLDWLVLIEISTLKTVELFERISGTRRTSLAD